MPSHDNITWTLLCSAADGRTTYHSFDRVIPSADRALTAVKSNSRWRFAESPYSAGSNVTAKAPMDETKLWAAVVAAETELRLARAELAESEIEPHSQFAALDELRNRVAAAAVALALAQTRWEQRAIGSPGGNR